LLLFVIRLELIQNLKNFSAATSGGKVGSLNSVRKCLFK